MRRSPAEVGGTVLNHQVGCRGQHGVEGSVPSTPPYTHMSSSLPRSSLPSPHSLPHRQGLPREVLPADSAPQPTHPPSHPSLFPHPPVPTFICASERSVEKKSWPLPFPASAAKRAAETAAPSPGSRYSTSSPRPSATMRCARRSRAAVELRAASHSRVLTCRRGAAGGRCWSVRQTTGRPD